MKKFLSKKPVKYGMLVLITGILCFTVFFFTKKDDDGGEKVTPVEIQKPVRQNLTESITLSGYVEAKVMIPVVPFVQGTIMEYNAKAGDYVLKDTVLAKIDDAAYLQTLLQAKAAYSAAKSTFDRVSSLYKSGATSQQNYDSAKAQYDAMKAQFDLAQIQYDYTEVKAPVDGTILKADLAVGSIGTSTQPVAVLADLNDQVVRLKVPEKYFDLFQLQKDSLKVSVKRPAEKNMYEDAVTAATIENIAPYVSAESKNFEVVCHLDEPGERFRPGMYVKVNVAYRTHENAATLPISVKKLDGSCYTYDPETQTVTYVPMEETPDDGVNFVVPDEYADVYFVSDGQNSVFDGQKVTVIQGDL